jgi:hypothetical protein
MNRKIDWYRALALFGLLFAGASGVLAQTLQPLFSRSSPIALTIEAPFRTLQRERMDAPELPGTVRYAGTDGREIALSVQIRPRGMSRRSLCTFPPLRLNFKTKEAAGTIFEGQDKLKLVTHCKPNDSYRTYITQEYEIYKAYNVLTPHSFRVRWASIDYVDTDTNRTASEPAFLIEDEHAAAERLGMDMIEVESQQPSDLDPAQLTLLALFHYMIGNTDWSPLAARPGETCCHNGKVLAESDHGAARIVLPYDFDQAGLIDADYAAPAQTLDIRSVTDRLYRGFCTMNGEVGSALERMRAARDEVMAIFDSDQLPRRRRADAVSYVRDFYSLIDDPERVQASIVAQCR